MTLDRQLDKGLGPRWLGHPKIANAVVETFFVAEHQWELCELFAWVVMSNHVHVLLSPRKPLAEVTRAIKGTSARIANKILGRTGLPFWQAESFDHWVRNGGEFNKIARYIEMNPVRAAMVATPGEWQWSSAAPRFRRPEPGRSGTCPT